MLDNSKIRSTELYATLSQATKDVTAIREWLYASKDRIDEHILENLNAFDEKVKEALQNYENLSDEKLNMLKELYKKVVYPFDYVSDEEPTMPNVNETWFKTDEAKIFKFIKNPQITFLQKERPKERKINDIWFKPMDDVNLQVGEFYLCEKVLKNEAWINPSLPENLEPAFNQEEAPQNATLGDIWKKGDEYFVYIKTTSGNSWTSPENPSEYTPTYESEEEPSEAKLGEIWKKGNEYLIYARVTNDTAWILKSDLGLDAFIWFNDMNNISYKLDFIMELIDYTISQNNQRKESIINATKEIDKLNADIKDLKEQISQKQEQEEDATQLEELKEQKQNELVQKQNELENLTKNHLLVNRGFLDNIVKQLDVRNEIKNYLLKNDFNQEIAKYITLATNQTITGAKDFTKLPTSSTKATKDNELVNLATLKEQVSLPDGSGLSLKNAELLALIGFNTYLDGTSLLKSHSMSNNVIYTNTTGGKTPITIKIQQINNVPNPASIGIYINNSLIKKINAIQYTDSTGKYIPLTYYEGILKPNDTYKIELFNIVVDKSNIEATILNVK
ncbi:coiled-coil domain-containing protein [Campylobacter jejuni]